MMSQFLRFPESDSSLKYGGTVLTGINKSYIQLVLNFHLFGKQSKIGVVSTCTKTIVQTNGLRSVAHKKS